jgi:hypothetical protein
VFPPALLEVTEMVASDFPEASFFLALQLNQDPETPFASSLFLSTLSHPSLLSVPAQQKKNPNCEPHLHSTENSPHFCRQAELSAKQSIGYQNVRNSSPVLHEQCLKPRKTESPF